MMSGGKGNCAIKIGSLKTCTIRMKLNNWGGKRCQNHNGRQQFPNGCAKIITGGTQEVSQKVVSDEKPSWSVVLLARKLWISSALVVCTPLCGPMIFLIQNWLGHAFTILTVNLLLCPSLSHRMKQWTRRSEGVWKSNVSPLKGTMRGTSMQNKAR
jgi:hypothetical protein